MTERSTMQELMKRLEREGDDQEKRIAELTRRNTDLVSSNDDLCVRVAELQDLVDSYETARTRRTILPGELFADDIKTHVDYDLIIQHTVNFDDVPTVVSSNVR